MFNQRWWKSIGVSVPAITALLLLGFLKAIFGVEVGTNLLQTGITPGLLLGILNAIVAFGVYKNRI